MHSRRGRTRNKKGKSLVIVLVVILLLILFSLVGILLFYLKSIESRVFESPKIEPPIISSEIYNHYKRLITYSNIKNDTNIDFKEVLALDLVEKNGELDNSLDSILQSYNKFVVDENTTISFKDIINEVKNFNDENSTSIDWKDILSALSISCNYVIDIENADKNTIDALCKDFILEDGTNIDLNQYLENNNKTINYVDINFRNKDEINESITIKTKKVKSLDDIANEESLSEDSKAKISDDMEKINKLNYASDQNLDFISQIYFGAKSNEEDFKIFTSITLAQAILESNWGSSKLYTEGKNIFGIKSYGDWNGEVITMTTSEWDENESRNVTIKDEFRKYDNYEGSIIDHSLFLLSNPRYTDSGVFTAENYKQQAKAIKDGGYATDPDYDTSLINLIEENELFLLDD
ncbi:MAG: glucosaminidase domain-containing protein [Oscillospiraceae bacterium]|nr:glucosaminidase domain-containing protein [Oscillospiraceae bacterium]